MEAIMIAGAAVVAVGGWYSALDLLADVGIRTRSGGFARSCRTPAQRSVKQVAWVNI